MCQLQPVVPAAAAQLCCRAWGWLAERPEDAAELATMLIETAPSLNISRDSSLSSASPLLLTDAAWQLLS